MLVDLPRYIEIETSRRCNRVCDWCPNYGGSRLGPQELMRWELLERIVSDLAAHEFGGWIAFHNYNEPLLNPRLEQEIKYVRAELPRSRPSVFTNGDFLDPNRFTSLQRAGVSYLRVTLYPEPATFEYEPVLSPVRTWLSQRIPLSAIKWSQATVRQGVALRAQVDSMFVEVIRPDVARYSNRGGTALMGEGFLRDHPCFMTHHSAAVDYLGRLKMCCNVYPDATTHGRYIIGNVRDHGLIKLWRGAVLSDLRGLHASADWSASPICNSCSQRLPREQENEFAVTPVEPGADHEHG